MEMLSNDFIFETIMEKSEEVKRRISYQYNQLSTVKLDRNVFNYTFIFKIVLT